MSNPENLQFTSYGRSWMILLRGRKGLAIDRWLVRWTGFSLVSLQYALAGRNRYTPTLLLTTIGASSGRLRSVALPYLRWGDGLVVVASKGGGPVNPQWVRNIQSDPHCWLRVRRRLVPALGRVVDDPEREELYAFVVANKPNVARYQARASGFGRTIPLVLLTPIAEHASA